MDDPWNKLWCILWGDEVLQVPSVSVAKDGMGEKSEGGEGIEESEKDRQPVVEDNDEECEETDTTIVVSLKGEQLYHIDTGDAETVWWVHKGRVPFILPRLRR